jgi:hypothetical protein
MPLTLMAADLASLVFGLYDTERLCITDGIQPENRQKEITQIILQEFPKIPLEIWITGIKWRVINTIRKTGIAVLPQKDNDFVNLLKLYKCIFLHLNKQSLHTDRKIMSTVFLERMACAEWLSPQKADILEKKALQWYQNGS